MLYKNCGPALVWLHQCQIFEVQVYQSPILWVRVKTSSTGFWFGIGLTPCRKTLTHAVILAIIICLSVKVAVKAILCNLECNIFLKKFKQALRIILAIIFP